MTAATLPARAPAYETVADALVTALDTIPDDVLAHAAHLLFNALGVAAGAATAPGVDRLVQLADRGQPAMPVCPGRVEYRTAYHAALTTGFAAHLDDFDDTHLPTVIHPSAACLGAAWAGAYEVATVSARRVLSAFAVGCEMQLRLGLAVSPDHYTEGFHITGTCGVIGAAVTAALIHDADSRVLARAMRAASLLTLGHREAFGSELKPFHAAKAASNGQLAACHARGAGDEGVLRGEREALPSFDALLGAFAGDAWDPAPLKGLGGGGDWELLRVACKPFPCGVVAHAGITAALRLVGEFGVGWREVARVDYGCHPLVPELMGVADPGSGLAARFSARHGVSVALVHGKAGRAEFSDAAAVCEAVRALRDRVRLVPDAGLGRDEAVVTVYLVDGSTRRVQVRHAQGSAVGPLAEGDLVAKVADLLPYWLPPADRLWARMRQATGDGDAGVTGAGLFAPWCGAGVPDGR